MAIAAKPNPRRKFWRRAGLAALLVGGVTALVGASEGRIGAPEWVKTRVERELHDRLSVASVRLDRIDAGIALASASLSLRLSGLALTMSAGDRPLAIESVEVELAPWAAMRRAVELRSVKIRGIRAALESPNSVMSGGSNEQPFGDSALRDAAVLVRGALEEVERIVIEDVRLDLGAEAGMLIHLDSIVLIERTGSIGGQGEARLVSAGGAQAKATMSVTWSKPDGSLALRMEAPDLHLPSIFTTSDRIAALDLKFNLAADIEWDAVSGLSPVKIRLDLLSGHIPGLGSEPLTVRSGQVVASLDSQSARATIDFAELDLSIGRLRAEGHADWLDDAENGLTVSGAMTARADSVDVPELWDTSLVNVVAASDFRWSMASRVLELARFSLTSGPALRVTGWGDAEQTDDGWSVALDVRSPGLDHATLLGHWPGRVEGNVRAWLAANLQTAQLTDLSGALRIAPDSPPSFRLNFNFGDMDLAYLRGQPVLTRASGWGILTENSLYLATSDGSLRAPGGDVVDMSGTRFHIADFSLLPAIADIRLKAVGELESVLDILDLDPFGFLTKAGARTDLAAGRVIASADIAVPLIEDVMADDVTFRVAGQIEGFEADQWLPNRLLRAALLDVRADQDGLVIEGEGWLDETPLTGRFMLAFVADSSPQLDGTLLVSKTFLTMLGIDPQRWGWQGATELTYMIDLSGSGAPRFALSGNLDGVDVAIPSLAWRKRRDSVGQVRVNGSLTDPVHIETFAYEGQDLTLTGSMSTDGDGWSASLDRITLANRFNLSAQLTPTSDGKVALRLSDGWADLRGLESVLAGDDGSTVNVIDVDLERVALADNIALGEVVGRIDLASPADTALEARINDGPQVAIGMFESVEGRGALVQSNDAGAVLRAANMLTGLNGGRLRIELMPGPDRALRGRIYISDVRVRNMPLFGELISLASIIGALEQLAGDGVHFSDVRAGFSHVDGIVRLSEGSAQGASLGLTADGWIDRRRSQMSLRGRLTPVYGLNSIVKSVVPLEEVLNTRRGDGLGAVKYYIDGDIDAPSIKANPLSVLAPGFLGDLFEPAKPEPTR